MSNSIIAFSKQAKTKKNKKKTGVQNDQQKDSLLLSLLQQSYRVEKDKS